MLNIIAPFMTDSYKLSHHGFMDKSITKIYSNLTARSFKHFFKNDIEETVFFGLQSFIKLHLIDHWNKTFFSRPKEEVISEMKRTFDAYLGEGAVPLAHFEALHDLGYLPIEIRALPEGTRVPVKVPYLTIYNTHDDFAWVTNYLETIMSTEVWKMITTATSVYENRKLVNEYALKTTGSLAGTEFQVHDFCLRGMSGIEDGIKQGAAFLLSSNGTDNIPALPFIEQIYNGDITKEFIGTSIPATEHSIACSTTALMGGNEYEAFIKWITVDYPTGLVSVVADTWDYWKFLGYVIDAKEIIKSREPNALGLSKVVIRPDSHDPVEIVCGHNIKDVTKEYVSYDQFVSRIADKVGCEVVEETSQDELDQDFIVRSYKYKGKYYRVTVSIYWDCCDKQHYFVDGCNLESIEEYNPSIEELGTIEYLWENLGEHEVNDKGYKVLPSYIGVIYGDGINYKVAKEILERLEAKGFASTSVVFGFGSYSAQFVTRDTLGMAVKATALQLNTGAWVELFKDPITDDGMKKSAKGLLKVEKVDGKLVLKDQVSWEESQNSELRPVFRDGKLLVDDSFVEIRNRLWS